MHREEYSGNRDKTKGTQRMGTKHYGRKDY